MAPPLAPLRTFASSSPTHAPPTPTRRPAATSAHRAFPGAVRWVSYYACMLALGSLLVLVPWVVEQRNNTAPETSIGGAGNDAAAASGLDSWIFPRVVPETHKQVEHLFSIMLALGLAAVLAAEKILFDVNFKRCIVAQLMIAVVYAIVIRTTLWNGDDIGLGGPVVVIPLQQPYAHEVRDWKDGG